MESRERPSAREADAYARWDAAARRQVPPGVARAERLSAAKREFAVAAKLRAATPATVLRPADGPAIHTKAQSQGHMHNSEACQRSWYSAA